MSIKDVVTLPQDKNGLPIPALKPGGVTIVAYTAAAGTSTGYVNSTQATGTILSNNTTPSDGDTITIADITYTFKTALTPTAGQVLINGSADAALLNLIRAINHSGTPGTDYANSGVTAVAHPKVSAATSVTSHSFVVTALATVAGQIGTGGNGLLITPGVGSTLTGSSTQTSGGEDPNPHGSVLRIVCSTAAYVLISNAGTSATTSIGVYMPAGVPEYFVGRGPVKVSAIRDSADGNCHICEML